MSVEGCQMADVGPEVEGEGGVVLLSILVRLPFTIKIKSPMFAMKIRQV